MITGCLQHKERLLLGVRSYTVTPALAMNDVIFSSSCQQPKSWVVSRCIWTHMLSPHLEEVARGKMCSAVWSSWPQERLGVGASFN